jgi:hypothetical protein
VLWEFFLPLFYHQLIQQTAVTAHPPMVMVGQTLPIPVVQAVVVDLARAVEQEQQPMAVMELLLVAARVALAVLVLHQ